jgi:transposase
VLTERARAEACRRVGKDAHAVAAVARDLGVGWATIMRAVREHGSPWVEDPTRLQRVAAPGLDETSFLKATRVAPTRSVTGLVDLERGRLLDLVADRTRAAVDGWLHARPRDWLAGVATVALDPWRGYASALVAPLGHATVVVDHFHAIRLANAVVDQVRRRTQQATLGHRGRKRDPLYRIRKLLLTAAERLTGRGRTRLRAGLTAGDPAGEVAAAWQGKELLRAVYAAAGTAAARAALDRFYRWSEGVQVAELSRLARTVRAWEAEILAWHATDGCSNGPTEALNLLIKKVKRVGHGFATSPITACGCYCTAASGGRRTAPQDCEAAPDASWRRASLSSGTKVGFAAAGDAPDLGPRGRTPVICHRFKWKRASMAAGLCYGARGGGAQLAFHHNSAPTTPTPGRRPGRAAPLSRWAAGDPVVGWAARPPPPRDGCLAGDPAVLAGGGAATAYTPELNPVQPLWASLKGGGAGQPGRRAPQGGHCGGRGWQPADPPHPPAGLLVLRHCGLSLW